MLGISIYPDKASMQEIKDYIDLAHKYGFRTLFTCLLSVNEPKEEIKKTFLEFITYATDREFEVTLDVSPRVFKQLEIDYSDLSFFNELGATAIRLDESYNGHVESKMSYNPFDLDIVVNMSQNTQYIDTIKSYQPRKNKILGCHNFYPQTYSGLDLDFFMQCTERFNKNGVATGAFVSSNTAKIGPWPIMQGLVTLELHRDLPLLTQVKHYYAMDNIRDIFIGNMFASESELKAMSELDPSILSLKIELNENSEIEDKIILEEEHFYRGDVNGYLIRSTQSRVKYKAEDFKNHDQSRFLKKGDVVIGNNDFGQYKGELQIVMQDVEDVEMTRNVVGKIADSELFLLDLLKPWQRFRFEV